MVVPTSAWPSTWTPASTICGVQRWLTGSRMISTPGEAVVDVDEQRRVGPVESVDRLCRVADEEQVVAAASQQIDESVLERVEVLRLVDEHVPEPPADGVGERRVAARAPRWCAEHVVEVR